MSVLTKVLTTVGSLGFLIMVLLAIYLLGIIGSCFLLYKLTGEELKTKLYLLTPAWPAFFALTLVISHIVFWATGQKPVYE